MDNTNKLSEKMGVLAEKLLNQTITAEEKVILEDWYAQNPTDALVWDLKNESKTELKDRLFNSIQIELEEKPEVQANSWKKYFAIAASLAVIGSLGLVFYLNQSPKGTLTGNVSASSDGAVKKVHLPDHSIVWLKGKSSLEYPRRFSDSTRNVTLHGEALFEVAKDRMHPFVINTGKYMTRVLGTSFNINENAREKSFKLTVLTGKVSISEVTKNTSKAIAPVIVTPGNAFEVFDRDALPRVVSAEQSTKALILHGTEYDMNFEKVSFEEVKLRIEKKFNIKIIADKDHYINCLITADVTDQSLENTMKVVSSVLNLSSYNIKDNQITLTGGGCN